VKNAVQEKNEKNVFFTVALSSFACSANSFKYDEMHIFYNKNPLAALPSYSLGIYVKKRTD